LGFVLRAEALRLDFFPLSGGLFRISANCLAYRPSQR
jgi:hypothetical protein